MSGALTFMMGEFAAEFPQDREYASNHMWAQRIDSGYRFGFTAYAVRLLQDVYFLDWDLEDGSNVREKQEIGTIESKKAESSLYSPMTGQLLEFNQQLMADPSTINTDKYGGGWLFEIEGAQEFLSPQQYVEYLEEVWIVAQRTIKGQLND